MRKIYLFFLIIAISPVYTQEKKVSLKKKVLTNELFLSNQSFGAVLITPQEGSPVSGVVKKQYRDDYLLDIDQIFQNKRVPSKKNRQKLIPKGKRSVVVDVKTDMTNFPGTVFYGTRGMYRLDINNVITKGGLYRYRYLPHTIEIATYFGGDISYNILADRVNSFFNGALVLNFYTENRSKRENGYTPLVQLRMSYGTAPILKPLTLGVLFGGSQYVFDLRGPQNGIGWSMLANGGMSFDFSSIFTLAAFLNSFTIGGEVEFKAIYNFHKYVGVTFGILLGYHFTPMAALGADTYDQNILGRFSVGFIF